MLIAASQFLDLQIKFMLKVYKAAHEQLCQHVFKKNG